MTPARVSVIIPCYGGERFIRDAIASVLSQAGADIEVIVVDDGSPDASVAVVEAIGDPRIRVVRHDRNRGIAAARNTGLRAAQGDLVAFLDQDDLWLPGRVEAQLRELDRPRASGGVGLVFCDVVNRDVSGREWRLPVRVPACVHELEPVPLLARILAHNFVNLGSALMRRSVATAAGSFDEAIHGGSDDLDLILRAAEHSRFAHVARVYFVHRVHERNFTDPMRMTDESLAVVDRVARRHPELAGAARIGRSRILYGRAVGRHFAGDRRGAAADFRRALAQQPWAVRAWLGLALCALGPLGDATARLWIRARRR
jgi:glycosyltransferase involved in cell wall biosynthesis